ncbi:MCP four helix bundle domain-containing protein [Hanstruepera ponticola]|uniref:MCP four helix bundle domain-containing protein n=1 Tax=Hanstruepera ponticola TaxID=2042995 RepID=UPI001783E064|nr:MCP four helix bundle domain-containing protein [Hanstruepera ponticola]
MAFYNKAKWVLGILIVFVLIVATNLIDRNNFIRVKDSVTTIYEDRLIAKDIIFDMSKLIHEKEVAIVSTDSVFFNSSNKVVNNSLQELLLKFEQTKLTKEENQIFSNLKEDVLVLKGLEDNYLQDNRTNKSKYLNQIKVVKGDLNDLSDIQIDEGKRQMFISKKAIDTVELFTQIEIYLLIFLAIVIQIIIMYKPKEKA